MLIFQTLFQWIDLLWVPVALIVLHKGQRLASVLYILTCALTLRLQVELMDSIGFSEGILPVIDMPLYTRGLIIYSLFILIHLALSYFSPRTDRFVYMAYIISLYIFAFCVSAGFMLL